MNQVVKMQGSKPKRKNDVKAEHKRSNDLRKLRQNRHNTAI